jgi:hypothetical protein
MSLLTDASLIVTPNGYNKDKLYSVIPNTTLGDMDVSRGSSATRVNEQKLIEIARTNLVLYSEQFDNAYWDKFTLGVASAPVVTPNVETAPNGTMTADRVVFNINGGTASGDISQLGSANFTSVVSITRTQSVYIKTTDGTTKAFSFVSPIGTILPITVTSVYQRFTLTSTGIISTNQIRLRLRGSASGEVTSTTASIAIWGAQYEDGSVATEYIPTVASIRTKFAGITQDGGFALNIPRIDYPPLGGCPSILVEPARTNEISYSEQFDNAAWANNNTIITANATATLAPDGTFTADKFIPNVVNTVHSIYRTTALPSYAYTFSVFAKAGEETTFSMWLRNANFGAVFDLSTGTSTSVYPSIIHKIEPYPNGWYRCSVYDATAGTTANIYGRTGSTFQGNNVNGFFIWGAQAEAGTTVTSYIPTTTAAVPRVDDVIRNLSATTLIGQTEGTLFVDVIGTKDRNASAKYMLHISGSKSIQILFYANVIDVVSGLIDIYTPYTSGVNYKVAVCYSNTGNFRMYVNGFKYFEQNDYVPGTFSLLGVGCTTGGIAPLNSNIKSAILWKTALTDDQCILLTGPSFSSYVEMANNFPNTLIYSLQ